MAITLHCPCGKTLHVGDEHVGGQGQCPACGRVLDIRAVDLGSAAPAQAESAEASHALQAEVPALGSVRPKPTELYDDAVAESTRCRGRYDEDPSEFDELPTVPPSYKLYSALDVALATFLGSALGGFVLLGLNYRMLGERRAARRLFLLGLVITAVAIGIAVASPLGAAVAIAAVYVMYKVAQWLQGELLQSHLARGGEKAPGGRVACIGLLCGLAVIAAIFGGAFLFDYMFTQSLGEKLNFGKDEVYFTQGATADDARRLGTRLQDIGYFDGRRGVTVQVRKRADSFVVVFWQQQGAWNQRSIIQFFQELQQQLRRDVFNGHPVEIELCDVDFIVHRTLR